MSPFQLAISVSCQCLGNFSAKDSTSANELTPFWFAQSTARTCWATKSAWIALTRGSWSYCVHVRRASAISFSLYSAGIKLRTVPASTTWAMVQMNRIVTSTVGNEHCQPCQSLCGVAVTRFSSPSNQPIETTNAFASAQVTWQIVSMYIHNPFVQP